MQENDLAEVLRIEQQTQFSAWDEFLFKEALTHYSCWVLQIENNIVGFGILLIKRDIHEGHVMDIAVDPKYQQQGLGKKLMLHLIECAKQLNTRSLFLEVRRSNERAILLYENLGFNEIGIRNNYYPAKDGREDAVIFALELE